MTSVIQYVLLFRNHQGTSFCEFLKHSSLGTKFIDFWSLQCTAFNNYSLALLPVGKVSFRKYFRQFRLSLSSMPKWSMHVCRQSAYPITIWRKRLDAFKSDPVDTIWFEPSLDLFKVVWYYVTYIRSPCRLILYTVSTCSVIFSWGSNSSNQPQIRG